MVTYSAGKSHIYSLRPPLNLFPDRGPCIHFQSEGVKIVLYLVSPRDASWWVPEENFRPPRTQENAFPDKNCYGVPKDVSLRFAKKFSFFSRKVGWPRLPRPPSCAGPAEELLKNKCCLEDIKNCTNETFILMKFFSSYSSLFIIPHFCTVLIELKLYLEAIVS